MLPVCMLKRKTLGRPLPLCGVPEKSPAESKAAHRPLGLIDGCCDGNGDWPAPGFSLNRRVSFFSRSRTKTSISPLVSPGTRLLASDSNTTKRPSPLMAGKRLAPLACPPSLATLTRPVAPLPRLRTKMSLAEVVGRRLEVDEDPVAAHRRELGRGGGRVACDLAHHGLAGVVLEHLRVEVAVALRERRRRRVDDGAAAAQAHGAGRHLPAVAAGAGGVDRRPGAAVGRALVDVTDAVVVDAVGDEDDLVAGGVDRRQ